MMTDYSVATKLPYPKNLLVDAGLYRDDLPEDIDARLETAIKDRLAHGRDKKHPDRDFKIMMARYKEQRTYSSIGKEFGITKEAVRQSIGWVMRRLYHPAAKKILFGK